MAHRFTIGVEEEFQIIDPATCELRSHVSQIVSAASPDIADQVKPELHQSIVETGTRICENVSDLRIEMHRTRGESVFQLDRSGNLSRRALSAHHRRNGPVGAVTADLRHARARGYAG
jgi:carboxylate-amine ligase